MTRLDDLWLVHWPRRADGTPCLPATAARELAPRALVVDTCLRQLSLGLAPRPRLAPAVLDGAEVLAGESAWALALEIATGLRSAVPGETNVFGQVRRAWAETPQSATARSALAPVIGALFADVRRVRREYLDGVGGTSYGSLVRRLLVPLPGERLLLVGAGDLARSLVPWLGDRPLGAWNRRAVDPAVLGRPVRWFAPEDTAAAAAWADTVVFTTPADDAHDAAWALRFAGQDRPRSVVHLGRRRHEGPAWPAGVQAFHLDEVFDLARSRESQRSRQLARARQACATLAARRFATGEVTCAPGVPRLALG